MNKKYLKDPDTPIDFEEIGKGLRKQQSAGVNVLEKIAELRKIIETPKNNKKRKP
jgi:hypothetical protein